MEFVISQDWLQRKIEADPDVDIEAGIPIRVFEKIGMFLPGDLVASEESDVVWLKKAFGVLIRQLRRKQQWTIDELALKARVDIEDIRLIETDPNYRPKPRVVHQLAQLFNVPERPLMRLSGATVTMDKSFSEQALRFAAKSDDLSKLTRDEQQVLNEYVKYLSEQAN